MPKLSCFRDQLQGSLNFVRVGRVGSTTFRILSNLANYFERGVILRNKPVSMIGNSVGPFITLKSLPVFRYNTLVAWMSRFPHANA